MRRVTCCAHVNISKMDPSLLGYAAGTRPVLPLLSSFWREVGNRIVVEQRAEYKVTRGRMEPCDIIISHVTLSGATRHYLSLAYLSLLAVAA